MNYSYGDECAKAEQEFRNLSKDFGKKRQWIIKHKDLYKRICAENDGIETDLTITREHMENTTNFLITYVLNNFDDDSCEDNLHDAVLV